MFNLIFVRMKKYLLVLLGAFMLVSCGTTKSVPTQNASTKYKVGDMYNQNGLKGIVVAVDASGQHGTIMSLESSNAKWCSNKDLKFETSAFYEDDGQKNMEIISKYIENNNISWSEFPLFSWAKSLGKGWYIPAKEETLTIWRNINGGSNTYSKSTFKAFDHKQQSYGGAPLIDMRFYIGSKQPWFWFTSTEADGGNVYAVQFGQDFKSLLTVGFHSTFSAFPALKNNPTLVYRSRAVHKF